MRKQSLIKFDIPITPPQDGGCTRTIGYWKNHEQALAPLLPVWLGSAGGTKSLDVDTVAMAVDAFLSDHDRNDWNSLSKKAKKLVLSWMETLDAYNEGDIGPGHCAD